MKIKKELNNLLPKYKKRYTKDKSLISLGIEDNGYYLSFEKTDVAGAAHPIYKARISNEIFLQRGFLQVNGYVPLFFFELFKYIRKYQQGLVLTGQREDPNVKKLIKTHLIQKFHQKMREQKVPYNTLSNMRTIKEYGGLVDECFNIFDKNTKVTLVIQKRIGYKYYERTTYY